MEKTGRISALLQKGTKIVPQKALFYGSALRAPFWYRLFSQCFIYCFLGFHHFSLSFEYFLVFRSISRQLSGFPSFQKQFFIFRRYFKGYWFSGFRHTSLFQFSTDFFFFFRFFATFWCLSTINITPPLPKTEAPLPIINHSYAESQSYN